MYKSSQKTFEALHNEFQPLVVQVCIGFMKGDVDLAKDLSQDVFINIWNALDKFKGASTYKTWIYRITVNTCLKYIRDKKDKHRVSLDAMEVKDTPYKENTQDSVNAELYQAIGELDKVDRLIIMMVLDELEYEEIAAVMGISSVNLRVKIHRIKKQLKTILEHE